MKDKVKIKIQYGILQLLQQNIVNEKRIKDNNKLIAKLTEELK